MSEQPQDDKPPILDHAAPSTNRQRFDLLGALAFGSVVFAWFWLLILSTNAWIFSLTFGVLGCVAAAFRLRRSPLGKAERWVFVLCLIFGASACLLALT